MSRKSQECNNLEGHTRLYRLGSFVEQAVIRGIAPLGYHTKHLKMEKNNGMLAEFLKANNLGLTYLAALT